ncbi:MAG: FKBP-type peptidyl-prolyl cis-trans isomerase [Cyclobacteriaceae bacterium]|nr:FKBP-type peptidyl-prolyl cis-trans isomerase [Cyclobacteriaceae bacterium]
MRSLRLVLGVVLAGGFLIIQSCRKDNDPASSCTKEVAESKLSIPEERLAIDIGLIEQYLADHEITGTEIKNNVYYKVTELGTGETPPCLESLIKLKYRGSLLKTGYIFDPDQETNPETNWQEREVTFALSNLIVGWQIVLPSMPMGSKLTLYIPSGYGYGVSGGGGGAIPVNAPLIFDIELVEIVQ